MKVPVIVLVGLVGPGACAGLATECPTGSVAAYQACDTRRQVEQTSWGTDFRLPDYDRGEAPPLPPTSSGDLAEPPVEVDEPIVPGR